jgi:peptidyl-prolyl cis-trans isomerase SurA
MRHLIAALFFANLCFALPHNLWEPPFYNGVAAQVEKNLITYDDLRREMATLSPQIRAQSKSMDEYNAKMTEASKAVLEQLIERALLIAEFNNSGFKVPPKDADAEYRRVLKENFNDKVSDLVAYLQREGQTLPAFRQQLRDNMMAQALQERFRHEQPEITPDQILAYYNANQNKFSRTGSVKLSVITLKPLTDEPAEVLLQTAKELRARALGTSPSDNNSSAAPEDFAKLAAQYNQEGAIDWGWINLSDLAPEVKSALEFTRAGQIADPVTLEGNKILLIKVEDRHDEGITPLSELSDSIKKQLFEEQAKAAYAKWIAELRKKYFVKVNE